MTGRSKNSSADLPICGYTFSGKTCDKSGAHRCEPRADKVVRFFDRLLVHTKGVYARKSFDLTDWQEHDIIRPLFGEMVWSDEWDRYVRRYRVAVICLARKNGKSELVAGICLYLLVGDDEESAEVYGAAKDTKQARKVWEPAWRMVQLSKDLRDRVKVNKHSRRLYDEKSASYYEIITSDAMGELGHNPHGFVLDEVLSQRDDSLWNAMRTAAGTRTQPMMLAVTTETNEPHSFGAQLIDEAERVQEDQDRAPHIFAYIRKTPKDADPWDEDNWYHANPALGEFLSIEALRQEALEAKNDPSKENAFRQYRLNQRVQQTTRYIPLHLWDECVGEVAANPDWIVPRLEGAKCWGGLDLSARLDLTAWCLLFEDGWAWWRLWAPEEVMDELDRHTANEASRWAKDGWLTVTEGEVIDYQKVYDDIVEDTARFKIVDVTYDRWSGEPVRQELEARTGLTMIESDTTFTRMTGPMNEFMRMLKAGELKHGGNPAVRWQADNLEAKHPRDDASRIRPVKPDTGKTGKRIDAIPALFFAIDGKQRGVEREKRSVYEDRGMVVL